jgi:hypothetical protein
VEKAMHESGFVLVEDVPMPANNRILHFEKS